MLLLSNQGNIVGKDLELEATPDQLTKTLDQGWSVRLKIWKIHKTLAVGSDYPTHEITDNWLKQINPEKILCHAQNLGAIMWLQSNNIHFYCRKNDSISITNRGIILTFGDLAIPNAIAMEADLCLAGHLKDCLGICSNYIGGYL
jgi:hypothetical protein